MVKKIILIASLVCCSIAFGSNFSGCSSGISIVSNTLQSAQASGSSTALIQNSPNLYPGEQMFNSAGFPTLAKFEKGNENKPLVVFIPGYDNTARIAYGYPGDNPKDFLDYWLLKEGYSFLGISFPLENKVFSGDNTQFNMNAWANQIANVTNYYLTSNKMNKNIIFITWSYSGVIVPTAVQALENKGINVEFCTAFESLPPIFHSHTNNIFSQKNEKDLTSTGYVSMDKTFKNLFLTLLSQQNMLNGHTIIPIDVYLNQITGNNPVITLNVEKNNGEYVVSNPVQENPSEIDYSVYPICTTITGNATLFNSHVLLDNATWTFVNTKSIMANQLKGVDYTKLTSKQWSNIQSLVNTLPSTLHMQVNGTHFFFVGEKGAQATAQNISIFSSRVANLKNALKNNTTVN